MKKILTLICTLLCANVLLAQVGTRFYVGDLRYYVTTTNLAEVQQVQVEYYRNNPTTVIIPETVSYEGTTYSVTSIGFEAFKDCSSLTSVTIGNSVTSIGAWAFENCSSLTSITIPNSVTYIEDWAFKNCSSLTSITIPNSVTFISSCTFWGCSSLTSITIPNSVTTIGLEAFENCSSLTSVTIPNSVTAIGSRAFASCSSLTSVTIPNSVTYIGGGMFSNCSSLTSITIPNSVTSIEGATFQGCSSLTSITIPNSVTEIGNSAFQGCSSLTSVTIPNSVTSIGNKAFYNCNSLTSVTIGNSVTSIGESAFNACSSLTSVTIPNSVTTIGSDAFNACSSLTSITIPNSVTSIGAEAFQSCSSLSSITIPNSVTSIGEGAFSSCSSLTSITIPNSVTSIGNDAFDSCSALTSVSLDMSSIPANLFPQSTALQNITFGENVTSIASGAFNSYSFLQNVTCLATTPPTIADNTVFPYPNIATLTVPCGTLEAYSSATSFWNMFFAGRISENGYDVVATANNDAFGSVAIENNCSTATLTATANACYQFVGWNDGNTENPRLVTLSSDTTLTANFEVMVVNNDITATICEGQVYNENGFNVSEAGTYIQTLQTANGCDSIVTLVVTTYPTFDTTITATINAGEMYSEFGFNESEAGTYVQNLQTVNGCDSTITLILDVNSSLMDVEHSELSFYPNPTNSKITFSQAIEKVEVIDLTGRCVLTFSNAREINIESLPSGAYYLRLTNNDKAIMRKVIKE